MNLIDAIMSGRPFRPTGTPPDCSIYIDGDKFVSADGRYLKCGLIEILTDYEILPDGNSNRREADEDCYVCNDSDCTCDVQ
jgi:hypothetical protein